MSLRVKGTTLLEVLTTLIVISLGILGVSKMMLLAQKVNSSSYLKQVAVTAAEDILEQMRANDTAVAAGQYNASNLVSSGSPSAPGAPSANCAVSVCTAQQMALYDVWLWMAQDLAKLPGGCGSIVTTATGITGLTNVTITVQWDDGVAQNLYGAIGQLGAGNYAQVTLMSQI